MKKTSFLSIFIPIVIFLWLCMGFGMWVQYGQAQAKGLYPWFVTKDRFLQTPEVVAILKSEGYLYSGNYSEVLQLLQGRVLTENNVVLLIRAQLAEHQDLQVRTLLGQFYQLPQVEGYWGLYLADQGYLDGAAEVLQQAAREPGSQQEDFQLAFAEVMLKQGKLSETDEILTEIRQRDSNSPYLAVVEGDAALARGNYQLAWEKYQAAKNKGHLKDDPLFLIQYGLSGLGANQDVNPIVQEIAAVAPFSGLDYYLEAQSYLRQGNWVQARAKLQAALVQPKLPLQLKQPISSLNNEIEARLQADATLQKIVAQSGK